MGGDEFALANESPPIRISRDTQSKLFNKASESHMTNYYSPTSWSVLMLVSSRAGLNGTVRRDECIYSLSLSVFLPLPLSICISLPGAD